MRMDGRAYWPCGLGPLAFFSGWVGLVTAFRRQEPFAFFLTVWHAIGIIFMPSKPIRSIEAEISNP